LTRRRAPVLPSGGRIAKGYMGIGVPTSSVDCATGGPFRWCTWSRRSPAGATTRQCAN